MALKLRMGQTFGEAEEYEVLHREDSYRANRVNALPIGEGGAGKVFRAQYKGELVRAVKFLSPETTPQTVLEGDAFRKTFNREFRVLCQVTHHNVVKILDWGHAELNGKVYPFIAMEYVAGEPFLSACSDPSLSAEEFLKLVDGALEGLEYLHSGANGTILHSDIKSDNIRCHVAEYGAHAVLLDLGAAHFVGDQPGFQPTLDTFDIEQETTLFVSTESIAHRRHRDLVGTEIPFDVLREITPYFDLHATGVLLGQALNTCIVTKLEAELGRDVVHAIRLISERLRQDPDDDYYRTTTQVREDWGKLRSHYLAPIGIPELSLAAQLQNSIPTPRRNVTVTARLHKIVDHPLFQRLRDIPQLELASLLYPGAKHSRLQHALTTFDTAREYVAHLLNDPVFRLSTTKADIEATLLLALLHDIGHYPLSHMFEDLNAEQRLDVGQDDFDNWVPTDDELFWCYFDPGAVPDSDRVSAYAAAIARAMEQTHPGTSTLAQTTTRAFGSVRESIDSIRRIVDGQTKPESHAGHLMLAAVLSSTIDVDKASYLADDSAATGIPYGAGIDLNGLLGSLRAPLYADIKGRPIIAISDKGVAAAESLILARQWMFRRVYWHHTNRAIMAMCKAVIYDLLATKRLRMDKYLEDTAFSDANYAVAYLSDIYDRALQDEPTLGDSVNPIKGFLKGRRVLHKRLISLSVSADVSEREESLGDEDIVKRLERAGVTARLELEREIARMLSSLGKEQVHRGEILIDVPHKDRSGSADRQRTDVLVYSRKTPDRGYPLNKFTPVLRTLDDEWAHQANRVRVFIAPRIASVLGDRLSKARDETRRILKPS